ncbi:MAG TPA: hypothetical protein VK689_21500 [Armatimonadota bacterium]|nr:hypothetical protein [Armatimonadota bacterium]
MYCWAPEADTIRQYYRPRLQIHSLEEEWTSLESFIASVLPYLQSLGEDEDEE